MGKKPRITFLMGGGCRKPAGGFKVVFEYANRLVKDGFDVHIAYSATMNFKNQNLFRKFKSFIKYFYFLMIDYTGRTWFNLDKKVKTDLVLSLNQRHVPKSDFYVATAVRTSYYLKKYKIDNNRKLYLIQDFENWGVSDEYVINSYKLGFKNIVISHWLEEIVNQSGKKCHLIPNGFDFSYFTYDIPIENRNPYSISMLYHYSERKGCRYGLEALKILKVKYPDLTVKFFGVPPRPHDLPDWIEYYQKPDRETHNMIYNSCAINLAPSLQEGWGLTVGEAMMCGETVVCTETPGFKEMVEDGINGFIVPIKSPEKLAEKLEILLSDIDLRRKMANAAYSSIQKFTWEESYIKFKNLLG